MELAPLVQSHVHRTFDSSHDPGTSPERATAPGYPSSFANRQPFNTNSDRVQFPLATMTGPNSSTNPLAQSQGHTSSNYSIQSQPSSRSSDTTQGTTNSTLFSVAPPGPNFVAPTAHSNGHDVLPTENIMNSVADASSSLFQICVALRQRLQGVPGVAQCMKEEEAEADDDTDPVTLLWRTFRRGVPLMMLYNALQPAQPLTIAPNTKEEKRAKLATFKFANACISELKLPKEETFIITDLYGDDTTGFVKVARVVNRVLDLLVQRGQIKDLRPTASDYEKAEKGAKRTQRQHIVSELVRTERTYVQHLELLQSFKQLVEEKGVVPGDDVHDIFLNLNSLLDFQRRFLIRVEQTNALDEESQNWGRLFILYNDAFKVYEPYIANQRRCEKTVVADFAKLKEAGGSAEMRQMVESPTSLYGFLMKPFQRLSKYPLLLDDLYKKGDLDEEKKDDLLQGKMAATSVLSRTNMAVDIEERAEAVQDLKMRVEDWKGHRVEHFGDLLLYGTFTVLKSEVISATGKDNGERQYQVYLFEAILLCCKTIDLNKPKNKLSNKNLTDLRGKPKLQLKGRIFMQNVTDLISLAKPGMPSLKDFFLKIVATQGIFWKGDPGIENFIIRFTTEETMRKWANQIQSQRGKYRESRAGAHRSDGSRAGGSGTSTTELYHMQNQPPVENPYKQDGEEEDDDEDTESMGASITWPGHPNRSEYSQSLNGSSSSLRSISTTGDSSQHPSSIISTRSIPPRLPHGSLQPQHLTLRTRELQQSAVSPTFQGPMESYFSPITDSSPMSSSRTSASSSMYPFPRQALSQNGYYEDGHGGTRFTAPAMGRSPVSREHSAPTPSTYAPPGRGPVQRPVHPPGAGMHSSQQMPPRNRSASSPDIHNALRLPGQNRNQPPVPDVPAGFQHPHPIVSRSQNNSPSVTNGLPGRDSPQLQRERQFPQADASSPVEHPQGDPRSFGSRNITPGVPRGQYPGPQQTASPPNAYPSAVSNGESHGAPPSQLKVKVHCPSAAQTLTLVVSNNITYQTLKDRIDAKLQRSTNLSLSDRAPRETQVKLKYLDEDDLISIQSDEDVQIAFETWREQKGEVFGGMGEIELFCTK